MEFIDTLLKTKNFFQKDYYAGAPSILVSERVLNSYGNPIDADPRDDLHILIWSLYLDVNQSNLNETFINIDDTNLVCKYWEDIFQNETWKTMHRHCNDLAYYKLKCMIENL